MSLSEQKNMWAPDRAAARDPLLARRLWEVSEELTGVVYTGL